MKPFLIIAAITTLVGGYVTAAVLTGDYEIESNRVLREELKNINAAMQAREAMRDEYTKTEETVNLFRSTEVPELSQEDIIREKIIASNTDVNYKLTYYNKNCITDWDVICSAIVESLN